MNSWNGFDFLIFLILALNTILGMTRGATKEIISMMCLSLALIITIKFTIPLAAFFNSSPLISSVVENNIVQNFMIAIGAGPLTEDLLDQIFYGLSLLVLFVGTFSITEGCLNYTGFVQVFSFPYAALNTKLGAALGCTRGYVISLIFISIFTLHIFKGNSNFITGSFFSQLFATGAIRLDSIISGQNPEDYQKIFEGKELYDSGKIMQQLGAPDGGILPSPGSGTSPESGTSPSSGITPASGILPTTGTAPVGGTTP